MIRDDGLEGKVAVISGGGSGIGRALAVAYARAGTHSVIGYLPSDPHDATDTVRAVEAAGGRCTAVPMDVRSFEDTEKLARTALDEFGRLDISVAAAGILRRAALADMTDQAWDDMMAVDLSGVAVAWAGERAREAGVRLRLVCGDAFARDGAELDGPYDLVYDSGCFHHLPPHRRISYLTLVDRLLAPGGMFALTCFAAGASGRDQLS